MAADLQRQMMDEMMGKNRDGDREEKQYEVTDPAVCRSFMCGMCPRTLFFNTKADTGECPKVHDPALKEKYEEQKKKTGDDLGFNAEKYTDLMKYVEDANSQIHRSQSRLEDDDAKISLTVDDDAEVQRISAEIKEAVDKAEALGEEGQVDESQEMMQQVEALRLQKVEAQAQAALKKMPKEMAGVMSAASNPNQKLRVCEICGAFLSILDSDRRLADHFGGKLHLGYAKIRDELEKMKAKGLNKRKLPDMPQRGYQGSNGSGGYAPDRGRGGDDRGRGRDGSSYDRGRGGGRDDYYRRDDRRDDRRGSGGGGGGYDRDRRDYRRDDRDNHRRDDRRDDRGRDSDYGRRRY